MGTQASRLKPNASSWLASVAARSKLVSAASGAAARRRGGVARDRVRAARPPAARTWTGQTKRTGKSGQVHCYRGRVRSRWATAGGTVSQTLRQTQGQVSPASAAQGVNVSHGCGSASESAPLEIVFLWKQNDTGLYGRRQEMIARELARHPRVRRVWHFDAPMDVRQYVRRLGREVFGPTEASLALRQLVKRKLGLANVGKKLRQDTFLMLDSRKPLFGRLARGIGTGGGWPDYLARTVRPEPSSKIVLWVCPVVPDVPDIVQRLQPDLIVADVIDDQRLWTAGPAERKAMEGAYQAALAHAHLAFANCQSVLDGLLAGFSNAYLMAHGIDIPVAEDRRSPRDLRRVPRPIVGYVGDLDSARLDARLVATMAASRPDWSFVFIGAKHRNSGLASLESMSNVRFLGVRRYELALKYIRGFDVAIIPHLDNALTRHMSPLKLSVYLACGVPVVTSAVANLGIWEPHVSVARTPTEFTAAVERLLAGRGRPNEDLKRALRANSWAARVGVMVKLIDSDLRQRHAGG